MLANAAKFSGEVVLTRFSSIDSSAELIYTFFEV